LNTDFIPQRSDRQFIVTMAARKVIVLLFASVFLGSSLRVTVDSSANPIRRVVSMLQAMQKKVAAEGEKEKELME
jgi:hypothetical protein